MKYYEGCIDVDWENENIEKIFSKYSNDFDEFKLVLEFNDSVSYEDFLSFLLEKKIVESVVLNDDEKAKVYEYLRFGKEIIEVAKKLVIVYEKLDMIYSDYVPIKMRQVFQYDGSSNIVLHCMTKNMEEVVFSTDSDWLFRFHSTDVELRAGFLEADFLLRGIQNTSISCEYEIYF